MKEGNPTFPGDELPLKDVPEPAAPMQQPVGRYDIDMGRSINGFGRVGVSCQLLSCDFTVNLRKSRKIPTGSVMGSHSLSFLCNKQIP